MACAFFSLEAPDGNSAAFGVHTKLLRSMLPVYDHIKQRARRIVSRFPPPAFYSQYVLECDFSRNHFQADPILQQLLDFVSLNLEDDFGHGLQHAVKVAIDAGALMIIEGGLAGYAESAVRRRVCLVQCAGLLHDIRRKQADHATKGALLARQVLKGYPFSGDEIEDVCLAIQNHEAFKLGVPVNTPEGALVADCLYDADKFRWGPDNFTDTLWDMVAFFNPPLATFLRRYPEGMAKLEKIRTTFRTATGKLYGPQFIDLGLAIGEELYRLIRAEFSQHL